MFGLMRAVPLALRADLLPCCLWICGVLNRLKLAHRLDASFDSSLQTDGTVRALVDLQPTMILKISLFCPRLPIQPGLAQVAASQCAG